MTSFDLIHDHNGGHLDDRSAAHARPSGRGQEPPSALTARQLQAIDAWNASRRIRTHTMRQATRSRADTLEAARRQGILDCAHQAMLTQAGQALTSDPGPMRCKTSTAIIVHRHDWFAQRVRLGLQDRGVSVLACLDNAATGLGVLVAEQPDLLLVGDRLVMMTGRALLAEASLFAPETVLAAQSSQDSDGLYEAGARHVFPRHETPDSVAAYLDELLQQHAVEWSWGL